LFICIAFQICLTPAKAGAPVAPISGSGAPASAIPQDVAEDRSIRQQNHLRDALGLACDRKAAANEIIVCGKRGPSPYRLPLAPDPEPGAQRVGEAANSLDVMALNPAWCPPAAARPDSPNLDILAMAATAVAIAVKVADPERERVKPVRAKNCG
jgi:hypothetical protein